MVVLDTDHLSLLLLAESEAAEKIAMRLASRYIRKLTTTIVTYEEQTRGWLAQIARARNLPQEIEAYRRLKTSLQDFCTMEVLDFDDEAAAEYRRLRGMKIRIGTMDLKIAAIALAHDATLLSRNLVDFRKVPELKVEDWTT
jgi:tRNA(fMet)-specific endonuclease VapC